MVLFYGGLLCFGLSVARSALWGQTGAHVFVVTLVTLICSIVTLKLTHARVDPLAGVMLTRGRVPLGASRVPPRPAHPRASLGDLACTTRGKSPGHPTGGPRGGLH